VTNLGDDLFALACEDGTLYTVNGRDGQFKARDYGDSILKMAAYPGLPLVVIALESGNVLRVNTQTHHAVKVDVEGGPVVAMAGGMCGDTPVVFVCTPQRIYVVTPKGRVLMHRALRYKFPSTIYIEGDDLKVRYDHEGVVETLDSDTLYHLGVEQWVGPVVDVCADSGAVLFQDGLNLGVRPRQDSGLVYYLPEAPFIDDGKLHNMGKIAVVWAENAVTIYDVPAEKVIRRVTVADTINDIAFSDDLLFVAHRSGFTSFKII
jgi:hypothetical protein